MEPAKGEFPYLNDCLHYILYTKRAPTATASTLEILNKYKVYGYHISHKNASFDTTGSLIQSPKYGFGSLVLLKHWQHFSDLCWLSFENCLPDVAI